MNTVRYISCLVYVFTLSSLTIDYTAQAQIPDNTLPTPTRTINSGNITEIVEGTEVGKNLFHSFAEFSVQEGQTIRFLNNNAAIKNVISRVTGASLSRISGKISSGGNFPDFNLFLLNPNGIIFGRSASLDVKRSFVATTADSIQFGDQGFFSATDPTVSPLLTVNPSAFLFNRIAAQRGSITINSRRNIGVDRSQIPIFEGLRLSREQSLLLVGGEVRIDGGIIEAPNGRVELGGLAETGTVELNVEGNTLSLSFPDSETRADVILTNRAKIDVTHQGSGSIAINARNIEILSKSQLFSGIQSGFITSGGKAGEISFNATEAITINDSLIESNVLEPQAVGNSSDIFLKAESLSMVDGGRILTLSSGKGNSGNITVDIRDRVLLTGQNNRMIPSQIDSILLPGGEGKSGDITIRANSFSLVDSASMMTSTGGIGNAGNISLLINTFVSLEGITERSDPNTNTQIRTGVEAGAVGNGGIINIQAQSLMLMGGSQLIASVVGPDSELGFSGARGKGGAIVINVSDSVDISGTGRINGLFSGVFASIESGAEGQAGNITINTNSLRISDSAIITVDSQGMGAAGNLNINVSSVRLDNSGTLSAATQSGQGGNIILNVQDILQLRNNSQISTTSDGTGDAGNITIDTRFLIGSGNSNITANSQGGQGGAINITATGVFGLFVRDKLTSNNDITAFSELGAELNGIVELNTPEIDPSRGLIRLPELVINPSTLITQNPCRQGRGSELNKTGRGGLPPSVNQDLSDDATQVELIEPVPIQNSPTEENKNSNSLSNPIEPAQGWIFNEKGEVVLTAYNPNITEPQRLRDNSANCPAP